MTSGTFLDPPTGGGWSTKNYRISKSWSGSDGKSEIVNGFVREKWNTYSMDYVYIGPQYGDQSVISVNCGVGLLTNWTSRDEFELQSRLARKIRGHSFNLAVNVAQSGQVASMITSNIRSFVGCIRSLKRGDFANAARSLGTGPPRPSRERRMRSKDISGRWLEMQYGWLPAISDTFEAVKAYESITANRSWRVTASLKRKAVINAAGHTTYIAPGTTQRSKKYKVEFYDMPSAVRSLGMLDPLSVAWEIIPYSFVFDWFLPVGDYLENLAVLGNISGRVMGSTLRRGSAAYGGNVGPNLQGKQIRRTGRSVSLVRTVSTSLPVQRPVFIGAEGLLGKSSRIKNAIALAHQLTK